MTRNLILFCLFLISCGSSHDKTTVLSDNAMTIDYRIIIGKPLSTSEKNRAEQIIKSVFDEVDAIYNIWNPSSELSKLNRLKANTRAVLSPKLEECLKLTHDIVSLTKGRFDPTINPLQQLWKNHLKNGKIPSEESILQAKAAVGWDKIHFSNGVFYKDHDFTSMDLGGIAKGLCVDRLVERLNEAGFSDVLVEWGGEIRTSGKHPEGRPWRIFISREGNPSIENAIAEMDLEDESIATSGDYLQKWTVNGTTYFHIIDPKTCSPLIMGKGHVASASIKARSCAMADGLATAAMMFSSSEEAHAFCREIQKIEPEISFWIWVRED